MKFDPELRSGVLVRRYKRFLADVALADGNTITVHCPNTGAMTGCSTPGSKVWFSTSDNPRRKYPNTLELVEPLEFSEQPEPVRVGVNPGRANALVEDALRADVVAELCELKELRREVKVPDEAGRFDFGFIDNCGVRGYLEVKSVTLCDDDGVGAFPDAVSERALRHVEALRRRVANGERGVLLFCVQHSAVTRVQCAESVHPEYAKAVEEAVQGGVEVLAYACTVSSSEISLTTALPFEPVP